jgi:hypothetical protein
MREEEQVVLGEWSKYKELSFESYMVWEYESLERSFD